MICLFYISKNSINDVVFVFQNEEYCKEDSEIQIFDFNQIKGFDSYVLNGIQESIKNHYDKPYNLYFRKNKDSLSFQKTCKTLGLTQAKISNPIFKYSKTDKISDSLKNNKLDPYNVYPIPKHIADKIKNL